MDTKPFCLHQCSSVDSKLVVSSNSPNKLYGCIGIWTWPPSSKSSNCTSLLQNLRKAPPPQQSPCSFPSIYLSSLLHFSCWLWSGELLEAILGWVISPSFGPWQKDLRPWKASEEWKTGQSGKQTCKNSCVFPQRHAGALQTSLDCKILSRFWKGARLKV